ncbi:GNAT family N-acetyltransferase [Candidatus Poribacteria bacterium]|nr:GNAT family N-acetyltransferase [Candidatus Poribacteria bacterium]
MPQQLRMVRPNLDNLGKLIVPQGYKIRTYRKGDEAAWADIISKTFGGGWDADRCRKELTGKPQFRPDGLFFALYEDKPVGTTCAWTDSPDEKESGSLHMVGVIPEHRGKRLGYVLSLCVLHFFRYNGFKFVRLSTDDFRLPAIKTYLNLGFKPVYLDNGHRQRWKNIFEKLGSDGENITS